METSCPFAGIGSWSSGSFMLCNTHPDISTNLKRRATITSVLRNRSSRADQGEESISRVCANEREGGNSFQRLDVLHVARLEQRNRGVPEVTTTVPHNCPTVGQPTPKKERNETTSISQRAHSVTRTLNGKSARARLGQKIPEGLSFSTVEIWAVEA